MAEIMTFISDYGVPMVISGIFLYTVLRVINIGVELLENRFAKDNHDDLIENRVKADLEIQHLIDKALTETGGDRIMVIEFHNTTYNLVHLPFVFMSCNYEVYREGVLPVSQIMKNISTSLDPVFLTNLQKQPYMILDMENRDEAIAKVLYELAASRDAKKSLCIGIRTIQNKIIGYISLHKNTDITEKDISIMSATRNQINVLLTLKK
jgi:hypothetical protein